MCPFEAVLSHIEMYCDFTEVSSQEGSVVCATNHAVCTITECLEPSHAPPQRPIELVQSWSVNEISQLVRCVVQNLQWNVTCKDKAFFLFSFLSDFMDNVTWSYAYFLCLKLLWNISTVQHKETKYCCSDSKEKEILCLAVSGINCMFKHWNFFSSWN